MTTLIIKYLQCIYGKYILEAIVLDDILRNLKAGKEPVSQNLSRNLEYLEKKRYIKPYYDFYPTQITQEGLNYLAKGGFTTEAKKSKNALFSFRISVIAITISLLTFLIQLFNWLK